MHPKIYDKNNKLLLEKIFGSNFLWGALFRHGRRSISDISARVQIFYSQRNIFDENFYILQ